MCEPELEVRIDTTSQSSIALRAASFDPAISPADPIAVLGILRAARTPKSLEVTITGESLFNDGVGVVFFFAVLGVANGGRLYAGAIAAAWKSVIRSRLASA